MERWKEELLLADDHRSVEEFMESERKIARKNLLSRKIGEASILKGMLEDIENMLDDYYSDGDPLPVWFDNWIANVCIDTREKLRENDGLHKQNRRTLCQPK